MSTLPDTTVRIGCCPSTPLFTGRMTSFGQPETSGDRGASDSAGGSGNNKIIDQSAKARKDVERLQKCNEMLDRPLQTHRRDGVAATTAAATTAAATTTAITATTAATAASIPLVCGRCGSNRHPEIRCLFKSVICRHYASERGCPLEDSACRFAHGVHELPSRLRAAADRRAATADPVYHQRTVTTTTTAVHVNMPSATTSAAAAAATRLPVTKKRKTLDLATIRDHQQYLKTKRGQRSPSPVSTNSRGRDRERDRDHDRRLTVSVTRSPSPAPASYLKRDEDGAGDFVEWVIDKLDGDYRDDNGEYDRLRDVEILDLMRLMWERYRRISRQIATQKEQ